VFALVLPFPPGFFWIPFWRENEPQERNFSFQNGSTGFPFATAGEEAKGQPRQSLGRKPFKPQTALLRWSRAVGPSRCPATGGNAHASLQLVTEWAFAKAGQRETSRLIWNAAFRPDGSEQQKG
jgi:hypothetical protein